MATDADVYIAKMNNSQIIHDFYTRCGHEIAGNFQVKANTPQTVTSLEEVVDRMLASTAWVQLIVCHGDPSGGLLLPLVKGGAHNQTGQVINNLAILSERHSELNAAGNPLQGLLQNVIDLMGIKRDSLLRLVGKLVQLRQTRYMKNIVEIRGCHLAANGGQLLQPYRRALGTHMLSAPTCRQLYLPINPDNPGQLSFRAKQYLGRQKTTMKELSDGRPPASNTRRRMFGKLTDTSPGPIVIDIRDVDGHTNVSAHPFMDHPGQASQVAPRMILSWKQAPAGTNSDKFILPVMWDNNESTYHVPLEESYCRKLKMVTY